MEWNENLKERGEEFRESDGGTAEAGDPAQKQNQTALECDDPSTPEAFYILRIESRIGMSAAELEYTGKVAE